jgi:flagella basal body P-ring formation protein FlgA
MMMVLLTAAMGTAAPATDTITVPVLAHPVEKGQVLTPGDFTLANAPPATARGATSVKDATGMEAARALRDGVPVRSTDLISPRMVHRGDMVTISYASGPLLITASGRALSDAGKGEPLRVVNLSTSRTIDVVAEKPGHVVLQH